MSNRTSVLRRIENHIVGGVVVQAVYRPVEEAASAGGIVFHHRGRIVNRYLDFLEFLGSGALFNGKLGVTAADEVDGGIIGHIQNSCCRFHRPFHRIAGTYRKLVLHIGHSLTESKIHGSCRSHGCLHVLHGGEAQIQAIGIGPGAVVAQHALQPSS